MSPWSAITAQDDRSRSRRRVAIYIVVAFGYSLTALLIAGAPLRLTPEAHTLLELATFEVDYLAGTFKGHFTVACSRCIGPVKINLDLRPPTADDKKERELPEYKSGVYHKVIETHFVEADLSGSLATDAVALTDFLQRERILGEPALAEDRFFTSLEGVGEDR